MEADENGDELTGFKVFNPDVVLFKVSRADTKLPASFEDKRELLLTDEPCDNFLSSLSELNNAIRPMPINTGLNTHTKTGN